MRRIVVLAALALPILGVPMANGEIIKGVMGIRGAEMS
jgi:hypothetical protein